MCKEKKSLQPPQRRPAPAAVVNRHHQIREGQVVLVQRVSNFGASSFTTEPARPCSHHHHHVLRLLRVVREDGRDSGNCSKVVVVEVRAVPVVILPQDVVRAQDQEEEGGSRRTHRRCQAKGQRDFCRGRRREGYREVGAGPWSWMPDGPRRRDPESWTIFSQA